MTVKINNYTDYRYFENGQMMHPAIRKCPCCRHRLPECDCGYGLMALDQKPQSSRKRIKRLMAFLNYMGRNMFGAKTNQSILMPR